MARGRGGLGRGGPGVLWDAAAAWRWARDFEPTRVCVSEAPPPQPRLPGSRGARRWEEAAAPPSWVSVSPASGGRAGEEEEEAPDRELARAAATAAAAAIDTQLTRTLQGSPGKPAARAPGFGEPVLPLCHFWASPSLDSLPPASPRWSWGPPGGCLGVRSFPSRSPPAQCRGSRGARGEGAGRGSAGPSNGKHHQAGCLRAGGRAGGGEVKFPGDPAGTPRRAHSASSRAAEEWRGEGGRAGRGGRWRSGKLLSSVFRGSCHSSKVRRERAWFYLFFTLGRLF